MILFPFDEYWTFFAGFTLLVLFLLLLDLGVFHRKAHAVSFKESCIWTCVWICLALLFNFCLYQYCLWKFQTFPPETWIATGDAGFHDAAKRMALEFLAGYIIEESLSIDNIFIFVLIFSYFSIPKQYQHRVLFFGILGALLFRAIFVALGSALIQYEIIVIIFGAFLIITGIKILFSSDKEMKPDDNIVYRYLKKILPLSTEYDGAKFFTRSGGKLLATPLFFILVILEFTDIIFAIDSVPAIFAVTREPFIVFTSNIFAILGLRNLYFMLASVVDKFHLLRFGLGLVLIFVGVKMVYLNQAFDGKFPITWSLGIIVLLIGGSIVLSFLFPKIDNQEKISG
jgi:tellurite resistance protein TerC